MVISDNFVLNDVRGFNSLITVGGVLTVENSNLASLAWLSNVVTVADDLTVFDNDALISLAGLETIDGYDDDNIVLIFDNDILVCDPEVNFDIDFPSDCDTDITPRTCTLDEGDADDGDDSDDSDDDDSDDSDDDDSDDSDLDGLAELVGCNIIEGTLRLEDDTIGSLAVLAGLERIQGDLIIDGLVNLESLAGLNDLQTLEGHLVIRGNSVLTDLESLTNLTTVANDIIIEDNAALTGLQGLLNITNYDNSNIVIINGNDTLVCTPPLPFEVDNSSGNATNCPTD